MSTNAPLSQPPARAARRAALARRLIVALVSAWVGLYLLGLALAPGQAGALPAWADWLELTPSLVRDPARATLSAALAWLLVRALRAAWAPPSEPQHQGLTWLTRVAVTGSALGPLLHAGRALARRRGEGSLLDSHAATELAAELSATYLGIPWVALGYLVSAAGIALWLALLTFKAASHRELGQGLARGLGWGVALLTLTVLTRPLVYYATGDDLLRRQDTVTPLDRQP